MTALVVVVECGRLKASAYAGASAQTGWGELILLSNNSSKISAVAQSSLNQWPKYLDPWKELVRAADEIWSFTESCHSLLGHPNISKLSRFITQLRAMTTSENLYMVDGFTSFGAPFRHDISSSTGTSKAALIILSYCPSITFAGGPLIHSGSQRSSLSTAHPKKSFLNPIFDFSLTYAWRNMDFDEWSILSVYFQVLI